MSDATQVKKQFRHDEIGYVRSETLQIVLPKELPIPDAIVWLKRQHEDENKAIDLRMTIDCEPFDGLIALTRVLRSMFGFVAQPDGEKVIDVEVAPGVRESALFGFIRVPTVDTPLRIQAGPGYVILGGDVLKRQETKVREIVEAAKEYLRTNSIYKGQAIHASFGDRQFGMKARFMELAPDLQRELIFGAKVQDALEIGLWTPITHTAACRANKIPLKRGVLLYGPYGTGKTMSAAVTASIAKANGWTFLYLDDVRQLQSALETAKRYSPCVIFAEDLDRAVTGDRSAEMDSILNTIDGVDSKTCEIITVLTTNHIDEINPAMLRPGRIDSAIEILPPDADAAVRLVKNYARGLLAPDTDLTPVGKMLDGKIPAHIREVTERGKLAAIRRVNGEAIEGEVLAEDLVKAANAMQHHVKLCEPKAKETTPEMVLLHMPAGKQVGSIEEVKAIVETIDSTVDDIKENTDRLPSIHQYAENASDNTDPVCRMAERLESVESDVTEVKDHLIQ